VPSGRGVAGWTKCLAVSGRAVHVPHPAATHRQQDAVSGYGRKTDKITCYA